jgi:type I restriction enzyme S subunit
MVTYNPYERYKDSGVEWIGEIPEHWEIVRFSYILEKNDGGTWGDGFDNNGTIVLRSTEITVDGKWDISNPARRLLQPQEMYRCLLKEGDLLLTKSSGSELHIGKTALVDNDVSKLRCAYSNFMQRLRPIKSVSSRYLFYYLNNDVGRSQLFFLTSTTTGLKNLSAGVLAKLRVPLLPLCEQQAIADYLDQKASEIDGLIADKEKLVTLLQEYRQAIISEAVTKGLNPHVKMKDSGVEWIGGIPEHWDVRKLKTIGNFVGGTGFPNEYQGLTEEEYPFYKVEDTNLHGNELYMVNHNNSVGTEIAHRLGAKICKAGSVIFPKVGAALLKNKRRILSRSSIFDNNMMGIVLLKGVVSEYITACLTQVDFGQLSNPGPVPSINEKQLSNVPVPFPPISEQQAIADYLDQKTSEIDDLISGVRESIVQLKSYRQSLISEAVTGKIDVRGVI